VSINFFPSRVSKGKAKISLYDPNCQTILNYFFKKKLSSDFTEKKSLTQYFIIKIFKFVGS